MHHLLDFIKTPIKKLFFSFTASILGDAWGGSVIQHKFLGIRSRIVPLGMNFEYVEMLGLLLAWAFNKISIKRNRSLPSPHNI